MPQIHVNLGNKVFMEYTLSQSLHSSSLIMLSYIITMLLKLGKAVHALEHTKQTDIDYIK